MKSRYDNEMELQFVSKSRNEAFARITVAAFAAQLDPTIEELADIKTAVSEAVTNCIVHAYDGARGKIEISASCDDDTVHIAISDEGVGINDIEQAMQPFFTTKGDKENRSGLGFTVMQTFMDTLSVRKNADKGITVCMSKAIKPSA